MTDERKLSISQILLGAASFRHREDFLTLPPDTKLGDGGVSVSLHSAIDESRESLVVTLEVSNASDDKAPLYSFHVAMHVILTPSGGPVKHEEERPFAVTGASILFPFVREAVASLTSRGRFGPLWLQPVNVAAMLGAVISPQRVAEASEKSTNRHSLKRAPQRRKAQ